VLQGAAGSCIHASGDLPPRACGVACGVGVDQGMQRVCGVTELREFQDPGVASGHGIVCGVNGAVVDPGLAGNSAFRGDRGGDRSAFRGDRGDRGVLGELQPPSALGGGMCMLCISSLSICTRPQGILLPAQSPS
jgi:hypothetical protein